MIILNVRVVLCGKEIYEFRRKLYILNITGFKTFDIKLEYLIYIIYS